MAAADPVVLLASEMGAGRGHITKLARIARAMGDGVQVRAAISSLNFIADLGLPADQVERCPVLGVLPQDRGNPDRSGNATFACYLASRGLAREATVRRSLAYWRETIVENNVSVLVADYAPLALWAARGLASEGWEIRTICTGTGYGVPPSHLPRFEQLLPGRDRVVHPQSDTLALLNHIGKELNLPALHGLAGLYSADLTLAATFAWLDPYADTRDKGDRMPPLVTAPPVTAEGEEVFVYLSTPEMDRPALIDALAALPLARRGYLPGASEESRERLRASGMVVEDSAVSPYLIAARSSVIVHAAQHGTLCMAALSGLPQLALPGHQEQWVHALAAQKAGVLDILSGPALLTAEISDAVKAAHADTARQDRARSLAHSLRADFPAEPEADLAARLAPVLAEARSFTSA